MLPFRIDITGERSVEVIAKESLLNGITAYLLERGFTAMRMTDRIAVEGYWKEIAQAIIELETELLSEPK